MAKIYRIVLALMLAATFPAMASALATFEDPAPLVPGDNSIPCDGIRATGYYTYTAPEDMLLTVLIPVMDANLYVSTTPEESPYESEIRLMKRQFPSEGSVRYGFMARKGVALHIKVTFLAWDLPEGTESVTMQVTGTPMPYNNATQCDSPLDLNSAETVYLELAFDEDLNPTPAYLSYEAPKSGYLYLDFEPSVTEVRYAASCSDEFMRLKHIYITEEGQTVGAQCHLEVDKGEKVLFRVTGFDPSLVSTRLLDPIPGTACDFPLPLEAGTLTLPAEAGDYYWDFHPNERGNIEVTSSEPLPGGFVEVMMDCSGWGSFTIYDALRLRTFVYDRIDYILHIHKAESTPAEQTFNVAFTPELPLDSFDPAQEITPGTEYTTPAFAGTYNYKVESPDLIGAELRLATAVTPESPDTRVNLYRADAPGETIARGLNLTYTVEPSTEYVLCFTVFDVDLAIPFTVTFEGGKPNLDAVDTAVGDEVDVRTEAGGIMIAGDCLATVTDMAGRNIATMQVAGETHIPLAPGVYIISTGGARNHIKVVVTR